MAHKARAINDIMTPRGAFLGTRIMIKGSPGLHYKAANRTDDMTPEQVVECITGAKVKKIEYDNDSER